MLRILAIFGVLAISYSLMLNVGKYDEATYEAFLREQEFPEEDIELFMQEHREAEEEVNQIKGREWVPWADSQGYYECEDFKRTCESRHGKNSRRCTGCRKPKLLSQVCEEQDCPPYEDVEGFEDRCGFGARKVLSAKWAVVPIDSSDLEKGTNDAFWRLFKYFNKANSQGVRIAKSPYAMTQFRVNPKKRYEIGAGTMAFYIPSVFQADPPTPKDDKVLIVTLEDTLTFTRAYGGERTNESAHVFKQHRLLVRALAKEESIPAQTELLWVFQHVRPGCGNQRVEVSVPSS